MLIDSQHTPINRSHDFESIDFGIKNPAIIFDILCNKMYTNPLKTMVQEYMCNARDAHREINNPDPISIKLPNSLSSNLIISDNGIGISPQRMRDVFVNLGESTKRADNVQTGGFGVGAKVGWAYGDSFTIVTRYNNVKSKYLAYISDGIGRLDLIQKSNTKEINGVDIIVPVKPDDQHNIKSAVIQTALFWKTKPEIQSDPTMFNGIPDISNRPFYPLDDDNISCHLDNPSRYSNFFIPVVDGVAYPKDGIKDNDLKKDIVILFNTGEVDVAVNREGLQQSKKTIDAINGRIEEIKIVLNKQIRNISKVKSIKQLMRLKQNELLPFDALSKSFSIKGYNINPTIHSKDLCMISSGDDYDLFNISIVNGRVKSKQIKTTFISDKRTILIDDTYKTIKPSTKHVREFLQSNDDALCIKLDKPMDDIFPNTVFASDIKLPSKTRSSRPKSIVYAYDNTPIQLQDDVKYITIDRVRYPTLADRINLVNDAYRVSSASQHFIIKTKANSKHLAKFNCQTMADYLIQQLLTYYNEKLTRCQLGEHSINRISRPPFLGFFSDTLNAPSLLRIRDMPRSIPMTRKLKSLYIRFEYIRELATQTEANYNTTIDAILAKYPLLDLYDGLYHKHFQDYIDLINQQGETL